MRILLIDRDPDLLQRLQEGLTAFQPDWQPVAVSARDMALHYLKGERFHLVIAGEETPAKPHLDLLRTVREEHPNLVRFLVSDLDEESASTTNGLVHRHLPRGIKQGQLLSVAERAGTLFDLMANPALSDILANVGALPSIPANSRQVLDALHNPNTSLHEIGAMVERDLSLTAQVLRYVNSAYVGIQHSITNPHQAVVLLGLNATRSLIMAAKILTTFQNAKTNRIAQEIYNHSFHVGLSASRLVEDKQGSASDQSDAIIAGTLHDVGKLILVTYLPNLRDTAIALARDHQIAYHLAEQRVMGVSHAEIGGYWLGISGLDDRIVQAVAYHHAPSQARRGNSIVLESIHVADVYINKERSGPSNMIQRGMLDLDYLEALGDIDRLSRWQGLCRVGVGGFRPSATTATARATSAEPHQPGLASAKRRQAKGSWLQRLWCYFFG